MWKKIPADPQLSQSPEFMEVVDLFPLGKDLQIEGLLSTNGVTYDIRFVHVLREAVDDLADWSGPSKVNRAMEHFVENGLVQFHGGDESTLVDQEDGR